MSDLDPGKLWYHSYLDVFLNRWYANYEEARGSLESHRGYLLPYQKHFFICEPDVISALGSISTILIGKRLVTTVRIPSMRMRLSVCARNVNKS